MKFRLKRFDMLSTTELYKIYQLRVAIFVVEQQRLRQEIDVEDLLAHHLFFMDQEDGDITAYLRITPKESIINLEREKYIALNRMAIHSQYRHQGLGSKLLQLALNYIPIRYPYQAIRLRSPESLIAFYQSFGFKAISEPYDDDQQILVDMELQR